MNRVKWFLNTLPFFLLLQSSSPFDSITPKHSIKDGDVVVSAGKVFALGFFNPGNSTFRYVGIWYYQVTVQTVLWVANREKPINDTSGILSIDSQGNLVLYRGNQTDLVWSTNSSVTHSKNSLARLYDSGNLVLIQDGTHSWQSFEHPTNTLVPSMKFGLNRRSGLNVFTTSWKSTSDPSIGNYSCKLDPTGFPQIFVYKDSTKVMRLGSWTGRRWSGLPEMGRSSFFYSTFVNDNEESVFMIGVRDASILERSILNENGVVQVFAWNPKEKLWVMGVGDHQEECDKYGLCGPNSNCDQTKVDKFGVCFCLPGFEPKSPRPWSLGDGTAGCIRKPNASICQRGEGFVKVVHVKVPDTVVAKVDMSLGLKQCEKNCLTDCSCTGYGSAYYESNGGTGCLTWHGDMVDIRTYIDVGQDFYVRVDAVDLAHYKKNGRRNKKLMVAMSIVSVAVTFFMIAFAFCLLRSIRKGKHKESSLTFTVTSTPFEESLNERNAELPLFDLETIAAATNNFSADNKLGQGGFGPVYKGSLKGKQIAIKRLSKSSGQGMEEFKNEITLIAKLQHRNLVRILGCCVEEEEKMLIYEYLPNKSLDSFIFDEKKRSLLDWGKRYEIICGIARGIVYLHQDSRLRIIHRDLKASNILLDAEMNPKISDFGMAKIFGGNQVEAATNRIVGTYGYMAPEYAMQGHFSIKSDVYSFGVLLVEIITGRRNSGSYPDSPTLNLIGHVWELWEKGKAMEIIDSSLGDSYPSVEVSRCIQIGLMCVQESATDRPKMSAVVSLLENEVSLPSPKQPAFILKKGKQGDETSSTEGTASINEVSLTELQGR